MQKGYAGSSTKDDDDTEYSMPLDIRVVVIPCVGDENYARRQMLALSAMACQESSPDKLPTVLPPLPDRGHYLGQKVGNDYFTFGEPDVAILDTFREMKDIHGILLDLIYGAPSWTVLLRHFRTEPSKETDAKETFDSNAPIAGREIMYVHSGGLEGISSQMMRYQYKGLIDIKEVQLPGRNR